MQPDEQHKDYVAMFDTWSMCRDAAIGQRAVHDAGEVYLPKLSGQSDDDYKSYKMRAVYFNATGRTVAGMGGLVFRKQPDIEFPVSIEDWKDDISSTGKSLEGFAAECIKEVLIVGRGGILVDYPSNADEDITKAKAKESGLRPYLGYYRAENIFNWRYERVNNSYRLIDVYLMENNNGEAQIRRLTLENGFYEQVIYIQEHKKWVELSRAAPEMSGAALKDIPFWFLAPNEPDGEIQNAPIEDLAYINMGHYRNSADIENGAHVAGLPTPYITGVSDDAQVHLGSNAVWLLPDADCKVGFLQCGDEGFATLEKLMDRKEAQMSALGARMLAPEKKAAEAAETAGIKRGGENSVLASMAGAVEKQIGKALAFMALWAGVTEEIKFELNKDYLPTPMSAQDITAWVGAWQSGAISEETFFEGLQAGEVISESLTFDDERERKENTEPKLGTLNDN